MENRIKKFFLEDQSYQESSEQEKEVNTDQQDKHNSSSTDPFERALQVLRERGTVDGPYPLCRK